MARTIDQAIADAIGRGAITEVRASHWRALARSQPGAVGWLDRLHGSEVLAAAAQPRERPFATMGYAGPIAAAAPPGTDPLLYAANPILDELRRARPGLVAAAMADDPEPPRLFDDRDLPPFTASGIDPSVLATLPWPLRRPVAEAPTLKIAYALVERYAGQPEMARTDLATARANLPYVQSMSLWLKGGTTTGEPAAVSGQSSYTTEALHAELFGDSSFEAPSSTVTARSADRST